MKKVQISLQEELLDKIDIYAQKNYMTRSGMISYATSQFLLKKELASSIKDLSFSVKKIAEDCKVDDNMMRMLEEFERISKLLLE